MASEVRGTVAESWFSLESSRTASSLERLKSEFSNPEGTYLCMKFIRSEYSPDDFDKRQKQHDLRCEWLKEVASVAQSFSIKELPEIKYSSFPKPTFKGESLLERYKLLKKHIDWYTEDRKAVSEVEALISKSEFEKTIFYLSPFLLCFALALRIAKVTGEIRHESA